MSKEDVLKVAIGVTSAFAGWILAQLAGGAKTWLQRRRVRKLLLEELSDLDKQVDRLLFFYSRQLEIHGSQSISSEIAVGLTNPIFTNYYKDALLSLNQRQRISYQLIHSLVDSVNLGLQYLRDSSSEVYRRHAIEGMTEEIAKLCDAWGKLLKHSMRVAPVCNGKFDFTCRTRLGPICHRTQILTKVFFDT